VCSHFIKIFATIVLEFLIYFFGCVRKHQINMNYNWSFYFFQSNAHFGITDIQSWLKLSVVSILLLHYGHTVDAAERQTDRYVDEVRSCWPQQVRLCFAWSHSSLQEVFWNLVKPEPGERRDQFLIAKSDAMVFDIIRYNWSCGTWGINCCQGNIQCPGMYTLFFSYYAIPCS
jgi:hypothetical protein